MIRWKYAAYNDALTTAVGSRQNNMIQVNAWHGIALRGPGVDLPAGTCTVRLLLDGPSRGIARLSVAADDGRDTLASQTLNLGAQLSAVPEITFDIPTDRSQCVVELRCFGPVRATIVALEIDVAPIAPADMIDPQRKVGFESRKSFADKIENGFIAKYLAGPTVLEVGYKGYEGGTVPIVPQAIGLDIGYPGYDGERFPFADDSFDAIYSSHCFEHIGPWKEVLRDWYRILKPGGFLIIVVPHQFLFERKRRLPSPINADHKRFYTSASLLSEIETAFEENSFRIRHLLENDKGFDYDLLPYHGTDGCYEIELVVEKIRKPYWHPDDGSVRAYGVGEFYVKPNVIRQDPWIATLDLSAANDCQIWGPYIGLGAGEYIAEFYFDLDEALIAERPAMRLDVACNVESIASIRLDDEVADQFFTEGHVAVPFDNAINGAFFEFRVWAPPKRSTVRPRFKGVVIRYRR